VRAPLAIKGRRVSCGIKIFDLNSNLLSIFQYAVESMGRQNLSRIIDDNILWITPE
jgi:hypothetical protein